MNVSNNALPYGSGTKLSGIALAALFIFGTIAAVMLVVPQNAYAAVTISSSSDRFFGPSLIRFEIKDDALVGDPSNNILVTVTPKEGGSALGSASITVGEIGTSGTFELFVTTSNAGVDPAASTFAGATPANAYVVRINPSPTTNANDASITLSASNPLQDGDTVEVTYGGATRIVNFDSQSGSITADRATAGNGNKIVLKLVDMDANTDPTAIDAFPTTGTILNLVAPNPITLASTGLGGNFTETGQNTGVFELTINVNTPATTADNFVTAATLPTGKSFTLTDHDVYETITGATSPYNAPVATSSTTSSSVTLQNVDAIISTSAPVTFANGIKLQISDADRNISTRAKDTLTGVFIEIDSAIALPDNDVAYTTTGAVITTTGASTTGSVSMVQTLTFTSDPGTTTAALGALSGTGAGITPGAGSAVVSGTGATRTVTITQPFTTAGAVTDQALGTRTVTLTVANNIGLVAGTGTTPVITGDGGAIAGAGNTQTVAITANNAAGALNAVAMEETGDNTGIFIPSATDAKVPINIGAPPSSTTGSSITLSTADASGGPEFGIVFFDPAADPTGAEVFRLVRALTVTPGTLSAPTTVDINAKFALTINDADLNTNPNTAETYTASYGGGAGATTPQALNGIAGFNTLSMTRDNVALTLPASGLTVTFIETGANTGIFTASNVDMQVITNSVPGPTTFEDGDQIKITYTDNMESPSRDSDAVITIGKPSKAITIDRTTLPVPMPLLAAVVGPPAYPAINADVVKFTLTVTDPVANINVASTDTVTVAATMTDRNGATITSPTGLLLNGNAAIVLTETGVSTGVFTKSISLEPGTPGISASLLNGAKLKFTYDTTETASATLKAFDLSVTSSKTNVRSGDELIITLTDADRNLDSGTIDSVSFNIQAVDDDQTLVAFGADETGVSTGVFTKTLAVGTDFKISTTTSSATQIEIKARERIASDASEAIIRERTISIGTSTGVITVAPTNPGPGTKVVITVNDGDLNTSPTGTETIAGSTGILKVTTDRTGIGTGSLGMKETGANTGIFEHEITFTPLVGTVDTLGTFSDTSTIEVLPGDIVSVRYTDETNSAGAKVTVSATFKVVSVDPTMTSTKTAVAVGGGFDITINDIDANTDPEVLDTVSLRITSNSDAVGFETTAIETGANTGIFTALLQTTDTVEAGSVTVGLGDSVQVKYNDKYPADYADRVKTVLDPAKDFLFNMSVGVGAGDVGSTSPSVPSLATVDGAPVTSVRVGQQVVLTSTVQNNEPGPRGYVAIVEVRDDDGITTFLQWQIGTLAGNGQQGVGISWLPDQRGTYELRVFVVSSLTNPIVLSEVIRTSVTVN